MTRTQRRTSRPRTPRTPALGLGACMCVALACNGGMVGETTGDTSTGTTDSDSDDGTTVTPTTGPGATTTTGSPTTESSTTEPPTTDSTTTTDPTTTTTGPDTDTTTDTTTDGPPVIAQGPSKGGPIAVNAAGDTIAVANKATDDVTLFALADGDEPVERARISLGDEPVSVAWSPDGHTLYVVSRASGEVLRVDDADTDTPTNAGAVAVGSEPIQAALSPTGARLYVTSWVDGTLLELDTAALTVTTTLDLGGNPHAVCVSNDGDDDDLDETVYVTDFYARPIAGEKEATDTASEGRVWRVNAALDDVQTTTLAPLADAGITQAPNTGVYPNQLHACAVHLDHVYVTGTGASPKAFTGGTTDFRQNVHGMIHAIDRATGLEDPARTVNLNALVDAQPAPKRFVAIPRDLAFADGTELAYVASLASDSLLRVDFAADPIAAGAPGVNFLQAAMSPTGVAISGTRAFVLNEVSRAISVIDLEAQSTTAAEIESAPQPADPAEAEVLLGQRFFETGLGRWSTNGWVSCAACHPHGTTDNVTWSFLTGPRQTSDVSATFDRTGAVQRILNWTAIFDEVHDFELNTRNVANGTGAIVSSSMLNADGTPYLPARIDFVGIGGAANPRNGFNKGSAAAVAGDGAQGDDWDAIEAYIRSLRSPRGRSGNLSGDPVAGRDVFTAGKCMHCHGGPLWTSSERYFDPLVDTDAALTTLAAAGVATIGEVRPEQVSSTNTATLSVIKTDANGAPHRHTCVVRKVGTFGAIGPGLRGPAEIRQNGMPAQGPDGYNIPSLLGTATGAPYLHNGAASTLAELLSDSFATHLHAGDANFAPTEDELADLIAFLMTIDDDTETIAVPADQRFCPDGYVPPPQP